MNSLVNNTESTNANVARYLRNPLNHDGQPVKYRHYRAVSRGYDSESQIYEEINPRGGATVAYRPDIVGGQHVYLVGVAYCNPRDNYCRQYGRAKAEGRLTQYEYHGKHSNDEDDKHLMVAATDEKELLSLLDAYMNDLGLLPR